MTRKRIVIGSLFVGVATLAIGGISLGHINTNKASQTESSTVAKAPNQENLPPAIRNGLRGDAHKALDSMVGHWNVHKSTYVAGGTPEKPMEGDITSDLYWIDGTAQRYLQEVTKGTLAGNPYFRQGVLGYSNMDKQYEWTTVDSINANQMIYKGKPSQDTPLQISMVGQFTDQGVLGDASVGTTVPMRFTMILQSPKRMVFELYFTPTGGVEQLADKAVYTR